MAEALITLKLTPAEFDLVREAIANDADNDHQIVANATVGADVRRAAREREARLKLLLGKLR
jgi:hypothetical protein